MKTKAVAAVMLTVFLASMLSMVSITPVIAENLVISEVERITNVCWFHLMTGQYPNGVWVGERTPEGPRYFGDKGYLGLTYRNLSPENQVIILTTTPGANHAFWHWPEKTAYEVWLQRDTESAWVTWDVVPDEIHLMDDLWFIGWDLGQQIEVTLELISPTYMLLFKGTMTIQPFG